jgi:hypothetical protein
VVFDASAKTSCGHSLNNNLMVGPTIQDEMYDILLLFRLHLYAFTADIAKMYRQVKVTREDSDKLRILWRKDFSGPVEEYRLLTVTYGTASAPFTATRTLKQLALDEGNHYPLAKEVIIRDFYLDDLMSGCNDKDHGLQLQHELIACVDKGGMKFRKWSSNDADFLESIPEDFRETKLPIPIANEESIKTLGLRWNTGTDSFSFSVNLPKETAKLTKRIILSEAARLYDPLGWLSPVVMCAKIIMQKLWVCGVGYDECIPDDIAKL